jgi:hypothetical protein
MQVVVGERTTNDTGEGNIRGMRVDTGDGNLKRTVRVHELDAFEPVLDQLLAKSFASNNGDGPQ